MTEFEENFERNNSDGKAVDLITKDEELGRRVDRRQSVTTMLSNTSHIW